MTARRGSALIMTITLMIFFAILCGAVIGMAQMNVTYHSFFEHRGILKQATLTFAQSMAENVREKAGVWWETDKKALGSGDYIIEPTEPDDFLLPMKFEYFISPDGNNSYMLVVSGEYMNPRRNDVGWNVSVDIDVSVPSSDIWGTIDTYPTEGS